MGSPFASLDDLRAHWSGLPADLEDEAGQKLSEASTILRGLYPGIDARVASGALSSDVVILVVCQMVATAIRREMDAGNGDNVEQQSFTTGPYTQSLHFRVRDAELFLSRMHRQLLSGGGARNRKAFTIIPGR